jgi:transposase
MKLYGAIDLHSNNAVSGLIDEQDTIMMRKKSPCELDVILSTFEPFKESVEGIAVESTFNWYWLVDGLMDAGYPVHLVNTAAVKQYEGLKYTDDDTDTFWLAHLLRLGILPTGHIYPKESRPVRDLLRKRGQLVQQRTTHILSIQNLWIRNTGVQLSCNSIKQLSCEHIEQRFDNPNLVLAIDSNRLVMLALAEQVKRVEKMVLDQSKLDSRYHHLLSVNGVGKIIALTIMLETGDINRFEKVGNFTSYCRCVDSKRFSNGKRKGKGNSKNGNKYLSWAFIEAANFAIRFYEPAKRYYQRKMAKTNRVVALKALSHKLARASYYVMRDQVSFDPKKIYG